jgi:adenine phosphoribosyltransferase
MSHNPTPPASSVLAPHADTKTTTHQHRSSTSSHPPANTPDPTNSPDGAQRRFAPTTTSSAAELSSLKISLHSALRKFPDFPTPGILFEDILPIFADPSLHESLLRALEIHIEQKYGADQKPDVIVSLEARGFLFGPSLALRIGAAFVPVRKKGKLPGPTETATYEKEYGTDFFQIQADGIKAGQRVLIVDDIIATGVSILSVYDHGRIANVYIGGSASAAGSLVQKLGGILAGYIFIVELDFLKGRDKLNAPVYTLLSSQEEKST